MNITSNLWIVPLVLTLFMAGRWLYHSIKATRKFPNDHIAIGIVTMWTGVQGIIASLAAWLLYTVWYIGTLSA
jgi:hypothetical protein